MVRMNVMMVIMILRFLLLDSRHVELSEKLTDTDSYYNCYPHNTKGMWQDIAVELQRFGGNREDIPVKYVETYQWLGRYRNRSLSVGTSGKGISCPRT